MRAKTITIILLFFSVFIPCLYAQEMSVLPNGVLENGDRAEITGDYVRVRTGPSLKHKILTKVNRGTPVRILDRDKAIAEINGVKNYWYHIKLEKSGIEGWMWGQYMRKVEIKPQKEINTVEQPSTVIKKTVQPELSFLDSGFISEIKSLVTGGDLNSNGTTEIIFLNRENRKSYWNISGYEKSDDVSEGEDVNISFTEAYTGKLKSAEVQNFKVFRESSSGGSFIVLSSEHYSYIYSFDPQKKTFFLASRINSPVVTGGMLDGKRDYLIFLKKNRTSESDGTVTYEIQAAPYESNRGRIRIRERLTYNNPLPIKNILAYDLDSDGSDEIICEIGGQKFGGGIALLKLKDGAFVKILNAGVPTYKDKPFLNMWGRTINNEPTLLLYTNDPEAADDLDSSLGFVFANLDANHLFIKKFVPVSSMLDDANNRIAVMYDTDIEDMPFLILVYEEGGNRYIIKKPVLQ